MTIDQLRTARRAAMNRGDHYGVSLCNRALSATGAERAHLESTLLAREDLRERVLRGEA